MKRREQETEEEFTKRVQTEMCGAMGWVPTSYTDADKVEYAKRLLQEAQTTTTSQTRSNTSNGRSALSSSNVSPQLEQMAQQVKDVLPQVPLHVIRRDLTVTANVDESITRLLDGTVSYSPESTNSSSTVQTVLPKIDPCTLNAESLSLNTAAKSFGKNANDRMKSYEERKQALIEASRLRYISKNTVNEVKQ